MREKLKKVVGNYETTRTQTGHEYSAKNHGGMYMRRRINVANGYLVAGNEEWKTTGNLAGVNSRNRSLTDN